MTSKIFILFLLLATTNGAIAQSDWKTIEDDGFTIQYPPSWNKKDLGIPGIKFAVLSSVTSEKDPFTENFNLIIQEMGENAVDLETFAAISEAQVSSLITKGKIIKSEENRMTGQKHHEIIYSGVQGKSKLVFEQHFYVVGTKAYVLTLTCSKKMYKKNLRTGVGIFKTFKLKD